MEIEIARLRQITVSSGSVASAKGMIETMRFATSARQSSFTFEPVDDDLAGREGSEIAELVV